MRNRIEQFLRDMNVPESFWTPIANATASVPRYMPTIQAGYVTDFGEVGRSLGKQIIAIAGTVFASLAAGQIALVVLGGFLSGAALSIAAAIVTLVVFLYLLGKWVFPAFGRTTQSLSDMFSQFLEGVESTQ